MHGGVGVGTARVGTATAAGVAVEIVSLVGSAEAGETGAIVGGRKYVGVALGPQPPKINAATTSRLAAVGRRFAKPNRAMVAVKGAAETAIDRADFSC